MVRDYHCATGECLHCGDPDGAHSRARRLAAGHAPGRGGGSPRRSLRDLRPRHHRRRHHHRGDDDRPSGEPYAPLGQEEPRGPTEGPVSSRDVSDTRVQDMRASQTPGGVVPRCTRGGEQRTRATPALQGGSLGLATRASGVCDAGERGVCDEVYAVGQRPGFSVLFAQGRSDGFSPEDVAIWLTITGEVCAAVADDPWTTVTQLVRECTRGRCAAAFLLRPPAPPRNGAPLDARLAAHRAMDRSPSLERHRLAIPAPLMSPEASVHACGGCCPVCRSGQIVGKSFDADAAQVWQRVCCLDCEAVWTAVYSLQGYAELERPAQVPEEEQARLVREVLLDRDLNPDDVLALAAGMEAALLGLPAIQEHLWATWREEHQRAAEEAEEREEP